MSKLFTINWRDLRKGLVVAIFTAILGGLYSVLQTGTLPTLENWETIGIATAGAAIAYLLKNLFTTSTGKVLGVKTV